MIYISILNTELMDVACKTFRYISSLMDQCIKNSCIITNMWANFIKVMTLIKPLIMYILSPDSGFEYDYDVVAK